MCLGLGKEDRGEKISEQTNETGSGNLKYKTNTHRGPMYHIERYDNGNEACAKMMQPHLCFLEYVQHIYLISRASF